jgi:hypothetical protein
MPKSFIFLFTFLFFFQSQAQELRQSFSPAEIQQMTEANRLEAIEDEDRPTLFRTESPLSLELIQETTAHAFAEYEETGYLIMSYNFDYGTQDIKKTLAKNLPQGVQLVIFTDSMKSKKAREIKDFYDEVIDRDRITVIYTPNARRGFWARDGVPVPVFRQPNHSLEPDLFTVVDARYVRFEQDSRFRKLFNARMTKYNYYFEGGNFMANAINECMIVDAKATLEIPDSIFEDHYGCKKLFRLPYLKGIGHADESVKYLDDHVVVTDEPRYIPTLEAHGYTVLPMPRPRKKYETYVNSLLINGTLYVPIFGQENDEKALQVYRDAGIPNVIGINTSYLSNNGLGSIHCITMTYPRVPMSELLHSVGGVIVK